MIVLNNLNIDSVDFCSDYVYIQQGKEVIQISRVLLSRIDILLETDDEDTP